MSLKSPKRRKEPAALPEGKVDKRDFPLLCIMVLGGTVLLTFFAVFFDPAGRGYARAQGGLALGLLMTVMLTAIRVRFFGVSGFLKPGLQRTVDHGFGVDLVFVGDLHLVLMLTLSVTVIDWPLILSTVPRIGVAAAFAIAGLLPLLFRRRA